MFKSISQSVGLAFLMWVMPCRGGDAVTTLSGLETLAVSLQPRNASVQLEGTVLWSNHADGRVILRDGTATLLLELQMPFRAPGTGERFRLEGECAVLKTRDGIELSPVPVVENNGLHPLVEQSGTVRLEAGKHPIQVVWFNRTDDFGLEVEYEGAGTVRQPIPAAALFRAEGQNPTNLVNGLDYRLVEGQWWRSLPNFDHMAAVRSGTVDHFDIGVRSRDNHVGIQFNGYIDIPQAGDYTFHVRSDDGSRLFIGAPSLRVSVLQGAGTPPAAPIALHGIKATDPEFMWGGIEGHVVAVNRSADALELELMAGLGVVRVILAEDSEAAQNLKLHQKIRIKGVGRRIRNLNGEWMRGEIFAQRLEGSGVLQDQAVAGGKGELPLLTSIGQVYRLGFEESSRKYPVKVRGVITSPMENNGAALQDASGGIYLALNGPINLRVGDYCEIEGFTGPYQFSHYIEVTNAVVLGVASLPEPIRPSWDQLINGSLHCNYVELDGVVVSINANTVTLLTRGGRINVRLNPSGIPLPENALGATIRLRGCLLADWDGLTKRVVVGSIYIDQQLVSIVEPAPADPFAVAYKKVGDLLQFDPQAGALQRIRVWGMLVHKGGDFCCLMDGGYGLRFVPSKGMEAEVGDMVDVSGFLELGDSSPVLREALIRQTERSVLPEPTHLEPDNLLRNELDATLVEVEGLLLGISGKSGKAVLEMQSGLRRFEADLAGGSGLGDLVPGSRLGLTGAYVGLGGNRVLGRPIDSFKLLLNSGADIVVLSRPPWWTLGRLLSVLGLLAAVLVAAAVWIKLLRRTVEERTEELGNEIRERQNAEHQREVEQERARVAHDLHDDLGAHLTEVNMLATLVGNPLNTAEERGKYADQMKSIALHMVTSLDEIVWAINPRNDKVSSLAGYFGAYAQRVLELASVKCGLDMGEKLPHLTLDPVFRREIFLAFKEALANIIQHAEAGKVWLRIFVQGSDLVIEIADDGKGFVSSEREAGADGLANMKERLAALGGECTIEGEPGKGTTVRLQAPIQGTVDSSQEPG